MRIVMTAAVGSLMLAGAQGVRAESITCGTHVISEDQTRPQTIGEIRHKCGKPKSEYDNNLYYEHAGARYRLHFNDNGELESIHRE